MIRARLKISVPNKRESEAMMRAVEPDNSGMAGLDVVTESGNKYVAFDVTHSGGIETFISTLEDVLRCLQAAKETLEVLTKKWSSAGVKGH